MTAPMPTLPRAKGRKIRVLFEGRQLAFWQIGEKLGLKAEQVRSWWSWAGEPAEITRADLAHKCELKEARQARFLLMPDNEHYSGLQLADMFHINCKRLYRFAKKKGSDTVTREEMGSLEIQPDDHGTDEWKALSGTENTGAGRGEIPDEVWLAQYRGNLRAMNFHTQAFFIPI